MADRCTQNYLLEDAEKLAKAKLYNKAFEDNMVDFGVRTSKSDGDKPYPGKKVDKIWWDEVDKISLLDLEKARKEFFDWLNQEPNEKLQKAYKRYKDNFLNAEKVKQDDVP